MTTTKTNHITYDELVEYSTIDIDHMNKADALIIARVEDHFDECKLCSYKYSQLMNARLVFETVLGKPLPWYPKPLTENLAALFHELLEKTNVGIERGIAALLEEGYQIVNGFLHPMSLNLSVRGAVSINESEYVTVRKTAEPNEENKRTDFTLLKKCNLLLETGEHFDSTRLEGAAIIIPESGFKNAALLELEKDKQGCGMALTEELEPGDYSVIFLYSEK